MRGLDQEVGGQAVPGASFSYDELEERARQQQTGQDLRTFQESTYVAKQSGTKPPLAVSTCQTTPVVEKDGRHWHAEDQIRYSETFKDEVRSAFQGLSHLMEACRRDPSAPEFKMPLPPVRSPSSAAASSPDDHDDFSDIDDEEIEAMIIRDPEELRQRKANLERRVAGYEGQENWNYIAEDSVADLSALNVGGVTRQITLIVSKYTCQSGAKKKGVSGGCQAEVATLIRQFWDQVAVEYGRERAFLMEVLAAEGAPLQFEVSVAGSYDKGPAEENGLIVAGGVLRMHMQVQFAPGGTPQVGWTGSSAKYARQLEQVHDAMGLEIPPVQSPGNAPTDAQFEAQRAHEEMVAFLSNMQRVGPQGAIAFCVGYLRDRGVNMPNGQVAQLMQGVDATQPDWPRVVFERVKTALPH